MCESAVKIVVVLSGAPFSHDPSVNRRQRKKGHLDYRNARLCRRQVSPRKKNMRGRKSSIGSAVLQPAHKTKVSPVFELDSTGGETMLGASVLDGAVVSTTESVAGGYRQICARGGEGRLTIQP
ncbi:unnamed protein product [Scytosiphon promiscuus]